MLPMACAVTVTAIVPGDVVVVRQWSGDAVEVYDDQGRAVFRDSNLLCVWEDVIEVVDKNVQPDPKALGYIKEFSESA